jgi:hypothetical protein
MSSLFGDNNDPSDLSLGTKIFPEFSLTKAKFAKAKKPKRPPSPDDTENRRMAAEGRRLANGGRNATWISEAATPASSGPIASLTGLNK